jgi:hypothetical protein
MKKLLLIVLLTTITSVSFISGFYTIHVHNETGQPINARIGMEAGKSHHINNLADGDTDTFDTHGYCVDTNDIKAYYVEDKDFKYPFIASQSIDWKKAILKVINIINSRGSSELETCVEAVHGLDIYIYPTKIMTGQFLGSSVKDSSKTICDNSDPKKQCVMDSDAQEKVQKRYGS